MDKIYISDLKVFARHGVYEAENTLGQMFLVSATMYLDARPAGLADDMNQSVSYGVIARHITEYMQQHTCQLIEAVAEKLAEELLSYPLIQQVTIEIKKPWAPVGLPLEYVSVEITRGWHTAYIALGSNMGDKEGFLRQGIAHLERCRGIIVEQVSSFLTTEPYGVTDQDEFLNGCVKIRTTLPPFELLQKLQEAEAEAGRVRTLRWGPRTLDLDLLFYDDAVIDSETLTVPHPEIPKRTFVLEPMAELAPWLRHPIQKMTIREMLDRLRQTQQTEVSED